MPSLSQIALRSGKELQGDSHHLLSMASTRYNMQKYPTSCCLWSFAARHFKNDNDPHRLAHPWKRLADSQCTEPVRTGYIIKLTNRKREHFNMPLVSQLPSNLLVVVTPSSHLSKAGAVECRGLPKTTSRRIAAKTRAKASAVSSSSSTKPTRLLGSSTKCGRLRSESTES